MFHFSVFSHPINVQLDAELCASLVRLSIVLVVRGPSLCHWQPASD